MAPQSHRGGELHSTENPEERFVELQRLTDGYLTDDERDMLERAFRFADAAHKGVTRKSGEPYIIHPVEVAIILADLRMDGETLCAALLHDTIEDTDVTYQDVATEFNENVAALSTASPRLRISRWKACRTSRRPPSARCSSP